MPTSHYTFRALPLEQQLPLVWVEGSFIAKRWEEEEAVGLYHMEGGFFCEVYYDGESNMLLRVRTFTSTACLEEYACYVRLDDLKL